MIEGYCRSAIWEKCRRVTGDKPLVWLKGTKVKPWKYDAFYEGQSGYGIIWDWHQGRRSETFRKAIGLFSRRGDTICQSFIEERFDGDWEKAISYFRTFDDLFDEFVEYFKERKTAFMDKTTDIINQMRPDIKRIKQLKTNSHGGVANLLKVLTRTMNEQGANIRSIAKMQYGVCVQAGVYLPDEFITDVMVASDMNPAIWEIDAKDPKTKGAKV